MLRSIPNSDFVKAPQPEATIALDPADIARLLPTRRQKVETGPSKFASPTRQWLMSYRIMRYPVPDPRQFDTLGSAPGLANRMQFGAMADFPRDPEAHRQFRTPPARHEAGRSRTIPATTAGERLDTATGARFTAPAPPTYRFEHLLGACSAILPLPK